MLAATTGIRLGEIRALRVENMKPNHIEICQSWEDGYGPKAPKADSVRDIPISPQVFEILARVVRETAPSSLLFHGGTQPDSPMSKSWIEINLRRALVNVGIPVAEQRRRRISFHAWRHFLNSYMRSSGVPDAKTRRVTGHRTASMTDWYTNWPSVDISEVVTIQNRLLAPCFEVAATERPDAT